MTKATQHLLEHSQITPQEPNHRSQAPGLVTPQNKLGVEIRSLWDATQLPVHWASSWVNPKIPPFVELLCIAVIIDILAHYYEDLRLGTHVDMTSILRTEILLISNVRKGIIGHNISKLQR